MSKIYVFDLDDTLVRYNKGAIVPKQTFHRLRDLAYTYPIYIISYNPLCEHIIKSLLLDKYIKAVFYSSDIRYTLISKVLNKEQCKPENIIYFDDRQDNIDNVLSRYPQIKCILVKDPLLLYRDILSV